MKEYFLQLLNTKCQINYNKNEILIWVNHNATFTLGTYYKIDKDFNLYLVVEKENEIIEIMLN